MPAAATVGQAPILWSFNAIGQFQLRRECISDQNSENFRGGDDHRSILNNGAGNRLFFENGNTFPCARLKQTSGIFSINAHSSRI